MGKTMVDSIKPPNSSVGRAQQQPTSTPAKEVKAAKESGSSAKSASTGLAVQSNLSSTSEAKAARQPAANTPSGKVGEVLNGLNDAISFSSMALGALESISKEGGVEEGGVKAFREVRDRIETLQSDIDRTIDGLREGRSTVEVMQENMAASRATVEDLEEMQRRVSKIGQRVVENAEASIEAHKGLDPQRVMELLRED